MNQRRFYIHPARGDLIFLEWDTGNHGWVPAMRTMSQWQSGQNRIYNPTGSSSRMITMPGHYVWHRLQRAEEPDILNLLTPPWIPDGQFMEGIHEDLIEESDTLYNRLTEDGPPHLSQDQLATMDRLLRPRLVLDLSTTLERHRPDDLLEMALSASRTAIPPPRVTPHAFPAHLVDSVLTAAETEGKTCPITMEPIRRNRSTITSCGHIFQKEAIREWLRNHDTCPECRQHCSV